MKHSTADALLLRLAQEQANERAPSVVAGLVRDGELIWSAGRGRVDGQRPDANTQYRIGSITKTFVAACVMRLRDEGRLELTDPLDRHLPGHAIGDATIASLLSHTSGLRAETAPPWWERTPGGNAAALATSTLGEGARLWRPGRRWHYSNVGYGVLGELLAALRGAPWDEVVRRELLEPLGMRRTTTRPEAPHAQGFAVHPYADVLLAEPEHDAGAMGAAGQLWSTIEDLARWAAFLGGSRPDLLAPATLAEMREPQHVDDEFPQDGWTDSYGLGLDQTNEGGRRFFGHGGSMPGFRGGIQIDAHTGDAVMCLANSTATTGPALAFDLLRILGEHEPRLPEEWVPSPVDPELLALTGTWFWGPAPYTLRVLPGGELELRRDGSSHGNRLRPNGDGTFTGAGGGYDGETLRIAADGRRLELASYIFTRTPYDPPADVPGGVDPGGWRG